MRCFGLVRNCQVFCICVKYKRFLGGVCRMRGSVALLARILFAMLRFVVCRVGCIVRSV